MPEKPTRLSYFSVLAHLSLPSDDGKTGQKPRMRELGNALSLTSSLGVRRLLFSKNRQAFVRKVSVVVCRLANPRVVTGGESHSPTICRDGVSAVCRPLGLAGRGT
jgi:hypothetical protein